MSDRAKSWIVFVARFFAGGMFMTTGIRKFILFPGSSKFVASMGVPLPEFLLGCAIALEIIAGAMLILGYRTKLASIGLIIFVVILTPIFHGPWNFQMPRLLNELDQCLKNLVIIGCLLQFVIHGPGPMSMDAKAGRDAIKPSAT